jgi:hypothetical protein
MRTCPQSHQTTRQNKAFKNSVGITTVSLYALWMQIHFRTKLLGCGDDVRRQDLQLFVGGMNLRRIGRKLGLHHHTVSLWVKASAASLPDEPIPTEVKTADMAELFTSSETKKQDLHHHDRRSANAVLFGLESGLGARSTSYSRDGRRCVKGQTVLQRYN